MGNGTTCNLHLVKQNAKRKGEVSTRFFFLFLCGGGGGLVGGCSRDFPFTLAQKDFAKAQTTQTPTVDHGLGVSSSCFMGKSRRKRGNHPGTRLVAPDHSNNNRGRRG